MLEEDLPSDVEALMKEADIQSVLMTTFDKNGPTSTMALGGKVSALNAMSLSKPIFAYLVLKLMSDKKVSFELDTPLYKIYPALLEKFPGSEEHAKKLTARFILSHETGLPVRSREGEPLEFQFKPEEGFGYSGPAIELLQEVIEANTKQGLDVLAQENIFAPLKMKNSTFLPGKNAANSLVTTSEDYALFIKGWMNAENTVIRKMAQHNPVSLTRSQWAMGQMPKEAQNIGWGLGWAVQKNDRGEITGLCHWGDGSNEKGENFRSFICFDNQGKGVVCLTKGADGMMLLPKLKAFTVGAGEALENIVFKMLGFSRNSEERKTQNERVEKIIAEYEIRQSRENIQALKQVVPSKGFYDSLSLPPMHKN